MTNPSTIGWTYQGRTYTPDDPCTFVDPVRCTPFDTEQWATHARAWVEVARREAGSPEQIDIVNTIEGWIDRIVSDSCTVFGCHVQVAGLIEAARAARVYAQIWSGGDVESPNTDPWSLEKIKQAAAGGSEIVGNWISDAMIKASAAVKKHASEATSWLPIAALVVAAIVLGGSRRW